MTKHVDTEQWKLSVRVEYVPKKPDTKIPCQSCRSTGKDFFGEDTCSSCGGNGFKYGRNTTEDQPELPTGLVEYLRKSYNEWKEQ
jgi:DnaJ-class molecular chaperone